MASVRAWAPFAVVLVLALVIRVAVVAITGRATIDMDGTEYVRVAQNILAGHGAIGIRGEAEPVGPLAPMFSWMIAFVSVFGVDAETAALAIAVVSGTAFVALVYALAATVYGRTPALYAAAIAAVLPSCVESSTIALSDAPFGAAAVAGTLGFVRLLRTWSRGDALICGIAFGIAYLLRPEGLLFGFAACVAALLVSMRRHVSIVPPALMIVAVIALCVPGVLARHAVSGRYELEGKSAINAQIASGLRSGKSYLAVADAIDDAGRPVGPEIDPRYYQRGPGPPPTPVQLRISLAAGAAVRHVPETLLTFVGRQYGSGLLLVLAAVALAVPWSRKRAGYELVLIGFVACGYLALTSVWHFWPRYALLFVPVVVVWAGYGVGLLRDWSTRTRLPDLGLAAFALLIALSLVRDVAFARSASPPIERDAGAWIASHTARAAIVDISSETAFYAGGSWSPFPYGDERAAARYLTALHPDYVVLNSSRAVDVPPLRGWFAGGLPASLAQRVLTLNDGAGRTLTIYRWRAPATRG